MEAREKERKERQKLRAAFDTVCQIRALERVRDNPASSPAEILKAVETIEIIRNNWAF